uniref:Uncharacterized protein n=1 Tax=Cucumis melo TaxID=3656 RepID=A0A9I9CG91_CUCME
MSWLRAAVIRAVEAGAGGKDNITRTVRNVAGTVVYHAGNAVVEGAKIIQDRIILQEILSQVQLCSKLEELLLKKKLFNDGDSPQLHAEKFCGHTVFQVNTLLSAARMRLHNAREEREHFDEASNQILVHLKTKES